MNDLLKDCDYVIFTDGSSRGNPGPGGYGSVIVSLRNNQVIEIGDFKRMTTNNEMELFSAIFGIQMVQSGEGKVLVLSDSSYVINGITSWIFNWQKNNWQTKSGLSVANKDSWQKLQDACKNKKITWYRLPGHSGIFGNERADKIATGFALCETVDLYSGDLDNYPGKKEIFDLSISSDNRGQKSNKKTGKAYIYLSLIDGALARYSNWSDCQKAVSGKKNAKYRKAVSKEDEELIIKEWGL